MTLNPTMMERILSITSNALKEALSKGHPFADTEIATPSLNDQERLALAQALANHSIGIVTIKRTPNGYKLKLSQIDKEE